MSQLADSHKKTPFVYSGGVFYVYPRSLKDSNRYGRRFELPRNADTAETIKYAVNWQLKEKIFMKNAEMDTDYEKMIAIIKKFCYKGTFLSKLSTMATQL